MGAEVIGMKEEKQRETTWSKLSKKPWFWPALYLSVCAVLLGAYFLIQSPTSMDQADEEDFEMEREWDGASDDFEGGEDSFPTAARDETLQMPVADEDSVEIIHHFYDPEASLEEQQDALVYYNNMYYQNTGVCIARESDETFEVTAAVTGEVVKAEKDDILGHVVELKHDNGIVTVYQSLEDLQVEEGDTVTQGTVLGMAGRSLYHKDSGVHVHFEVRKDGEPIDPTDVFHQSLEDIGIPSEDELTEEEEEDDSSNKEEETSEKEPAEEEDAS